MMMPQCDPLSPGFFAIVHLLLHLWATNISLNGCLERSDTLFYNVEERTIWWQFLVFCPGSAGLWWAYIKMWWAYIKMMFSSGSRFILV